MLPPQRFGLLIATLLSLVSTTLPAQDPSREYALPFAEQPSFSARDVLYALARAYPDRADRVAWRNGDWAIRISDEWFYYADGRLLPERDRERQNEYDPYPFYAYTEAMPVATPVTNTQSTALEQFVSQLEADPIRRNPAILNALWRITDRETAWDRQKTTYFLGIQTLVHREILEDLAAVEERILELAESNQEVERFVGSLGSAFGYHYREVDGTDSLSYHAYGVAIDLLPASYDPWRMYWRWAREQNIAWYRVAPDARFDVPEAVVRAFEQHGFIWGGKWAFYDAIHFEYRPEILILNGFEVERRW